VEIDGPSVARPDVTARRWAALTHDRPLIVAGTAVRATGDVLRSVLGDQARLDEDVLLLAEVVAELAAGRAARNEAVRPHALQPLYVRRPDAELARERAASRSAMTSAAPKSR
jgi:tRNA A37 threonylcarbamoyladenosine modification protein TsaB